MCTRRFDVEVRGWGRVVGLRFRPGGLAALTGHPASAWTDRSVAASEVLPPALVAALGDPDLAETGTAWAEAAERGLAALADERPDPRYDLLLDVVADMLADHTLLVVADVADRHAVTVRTLQRLFTHYVGVGPKWVLARYRMHDAVADLDAGWSGTLTDLAVRYGLVRPGPLHARLHGAGRRHARPVPRPGHDRGCRPPGIRRRLTPRCETRRSPRAQRLRASDRVAAPTPCPRAHPARDPSRSSFVTRPTTRWRTALAVASVAALGAALFSGTASASTETESTPVPIVTPDGVVFSYLLNTKVANPGQTKVVSNAVQKAGGVVVQAWPQIGVVVAHSDRAAFRTDVAKSAGNALDSVGATRSVPVSEGTPEDLSATWGKGASGYKKGAKKDW